jgi:TonB family protein
MGRTTRRPGGPAGGTGRTARPVMALGCSMGDYTILIVDYEPRSIELARTSLAGAGFKVEVATDGVAGLDAFDRLNPDLVLIEAMLPKKHGFEVCQAIKKSPRGKRTPVLITTSVYKGRRYRTQALHIYGCDEYIEKPIAPDRLVALCRRFLNGGTASPVPADDVVVPAMSSLAAQPFPPSSEESRFASIAGARPAEPLAIRVSTSAAAAIVGDLTEEEIMARLDAILPDDGMSLASWPGSTAVPEFVRGEWAGAIPVPEELPSDGADQPTQPVGLEGFAGGFQAPFEAARLEAAAEPELVATAPEHLPAPLPVADNPEVAPDGAEMNVDPQVVRFDAARGRKRRRSKGASPSKTSEAITVPPTDVGGLAEPPLGEPAGREAPLPAVAIRSEVREEPRTAVAAADVEPSLFPMGPPPKARAPLWVWVAVVGVVASGALYLMLGNAGGWNSPALPMPSQSPAAVEPTPRADGGPVAAPTQSSSAGSALKAASEDRPGTAQAVPPATPKTRPKAPVTRVAELAAAKVAAPRAETSARIPQPQPAPGTVQEAPTVAISPAQPNTVSPAPGTASPVTVQEVRPQTAEGTEPQHAPPPVVHESSPASSPGSLGAAQPAAPKPKKTVTRGDLLSLDEVDSAPIPVKRPAPVYTARARMLQQRGAVFLNVLVDETGKVADVQVIQGISSSDLNDAAERVAHTWVYEPAIKDGVPVRVWTFEKVFFGI